MSRRKVFRYAWAISVVAVISLGCGLVSQVSGLRSTAQSVSTAVEGGRELLSTGQAIVTQVDETGFKETLQAAATKVGESGLKETVEAAVTQIEDTGLRETVQAMATDIFISPEDVPPDVPIMAGEKSAFVGSPQAISYFVKSDFAGVLAFYQQEMPARGWSKIDYGTTITDTTAELFYEKPGRKATIVITEVPVVNQVTVVITLEDTGN
jgi:uncharacterized protein YqgV (UPF0045/DUF77 family)